MVKILPEFVLPDSSDLSKESRGYVYTLIHKETNEVFYVGKGTQNERGRFIRFYDHMRDAREGSPAHVHRKIRKLWREGQTVTWEIVKKSLTNDEANDYEKRLIAAFGLDHLTNVLPGGADFSWIFQNEKASVTKKQGKPREHGTSRREIYLKNKNTGEVHHFNSICAAVRALQIPSTTLYRALTSKETCQTQPGYFVSTEPFPENGPSFRVEKEKPSFYKPLWVKNKDEGTVRRFSSLSEAARELGVATSTIKYWLEDKEQLRRGQNRRSFGRDHLLFSKTPLA